MFTFLIISASLIIGFDLEDVTSGVLSERQKVAGYIMMIFMCLFVGTFYLSFG